jgi:hypothetical protein
MIGSDPQYSFYKLPAALEVALQRFGEWSDAQLKREQDDVTPKKPLYHYTGWDGLEGILKNRHLRFFSHDQQDDTEEFEYSLALALAEIDRIAKHGDEFAKEFAICVADLIAKNELTRVFKFYLFSVSEQRDSEKQWKQYGRDGTGFSIGFAAKIFAGDTLTLSPRANENAHVGRVVYGDSKTIYRHHKVIERAAEITHQIAAANRSLLVPELVHSDYINAMAKEYIARQMIWRSLTAKRRGWEHQSEVRLVCLNLREKFDGIEKTFRARRYIEYPLPSDSFAEILIGPAAPKNAEADVARLLKDHGYSGVSVTRSLKAAAATAPAC